jgi:uncharacterized protein (TIGR02996 family)
MTDAPAFFRAIEANPDDDTPRLVIADWLDENAASDADHARAEFIRVQCERARETAAERREELEAREKQILDERGPTWSKSLPAGLYWTTYTRGFLDPVYIGPVFPRVAEQLAQMMPIHHLRLFKARVVMAAIAACPQLALVRHLTMVSNVLRNADMTALAASPHLSNLQCLDMSENKIGIRGATDLATAHAPSLRILRLAGNPIKDRGLLAISQADWPALEHLDVTNCQLTRTGVIGLAESPLAPRLTSLQLSGNAEVSTDAWLALARAPLERLQRLDLSNATVTDDVIGALAANPAVVGLHTLHLGAAIITDRAARTILENPRFRNLRRLRISTQRLAVDTLHRLRTAFGAGFNPQI